MAVIPKDKFVHFFEDSSVAQLITRLQQTGTVQIENICWLQNYCYLEGWKLFWKG